MYYPPVVEIPGTDALEIASALAKLSEFDPGYKPMSWETRDGRYNNGISVTHIYHSRRSSYAFAAGEDPDILVTALGENRYSIHYKRRVNSRLFNNLKEELEKFRSMVRRPDMTVAAAAVA